jgi:two-component sensor histidine kinase
MGEIAAVERKGIRWFWVALWVGCLLAAAALGLNYVRLPVDGFTGDLGSFSAQGFRLQWVLEKRDNGLAVDDVIVRAGGHTVDEWLNGAVRGPEWQNGGTVTYEVLRGGVLIPVDVKLSPVSLESIVKRWAPQLAVGAAFLFIGTYVFLKRMRELAARVLMLFCVLTALHYWGDAFNFQYAAIPWRGIFWFHFIYEQVTYTIGLSSICCFAVVFPVSHSIQRRFPRLVPAILYVLPILAITLTTLVTPGWSRAIIFGNWMAWIMAVAQVGLAIGAGIYSARHARDPVSRAQVRWILYCAAVGCSVLMPGYVFPLLIGAHPLLPHPVMMIFIVLLPLTLAFDILRFRLFEIIINRTLVYVTLTSLLIGLYFLLVRMLTVVIEAVVHRQENTLIVVIAAVSIALVFAPLRRRVQLIIDRAFYRTKLDFQRLLPEMSEYLSRSIDLDRLSDTLERELPARLQISWASLAILDTEGERFILPGKNQDFIPADHPFALQLREGQPLLRLQPPPRLAPDVLSFLEKGGIELCIPLTAGEELVGIYSLGMKLSSDAYIREEVRLLGILGKEAGIAVQNSRLFKAERSQRELAEALDEAASVVGGTLDLGQVLDRILGQVERVVEGDAFSMVLVEDTPAWIVRGRGYERAGSGIERIDDAAGLLRDRVLAEMARTRKPLVVSDTGAEERLRSFVAAPVLIGETVVGILRVDGTRPGQFRARDAARLEAFTHHAAAAIANARLYERAQAEIFERRKTEERLVLSLREKEVLIKEVHHRVKNNLQVISSLLYLQSRNVTDPKALESFRDSASRVRSMALVHEMLYQSTDLARIDLSRYVKNLTDFLLGTHGVAFQKVEVDLDVKPIALSVDSAISCGLILNELIFNSLKHAFVDREKGRIRITVNIGSPGTVVMTVSDDGCGVPPGFDFHDTKSLGLQIVNIMVRKLNGMISIEQGGGTTVKIAFPEETNVA